MAYTELGCMRSLKKGKIVGIDEMEPKLKV